MVDKAENRWARAESDRMVTMSADALGVLMATGEGMLMHSMMHAAEGYPLGARSLALVNALDAARLAILEAR